MRIRLLPSKPLAGEQLKRFKEAKAEQDRARAEEDKALLRSAPAAVHDDRAFGLHGIRSPCLPRDDNVVRSRTHLKELCKKYGIQNISRSDARP